MSDVSLDILQLCTSNALDITVQSASHFPGKADAVVVGEAEEEPEVDVDPLMDDIMEADDDADPVGVEGDV